MIPMKKVRKVAGMKFMKRAGMAHASMGKSTTTSLLTTKMLNQNWRNFCKHCGSNIFAMKKLKYRMIVKCHGMMC